ncbi:MAG: hypothetical protein AAFY48_21305 [Bacteroidota bacterium]
MRILCCLLSWLLLSTTSLLGQAELPYQRIVLDEDDAVYGYYFAIAPEKIEGTLVLLPGFGQIAESVLVSTKLPELAYQNNLLTVVYAGGQRLTADSLVQGHLNRVLQDVQERFAMPKDRLVIGGFSAGGNVALRYTQLCHQYPDLFPLQPMGVFMGDSPVDLYHLWAMQEQNMEPGNAAVSIEEAKLLQSSLQAAYGSTPAEDPAIYRDLSPFSLDEQFGNNEQWLKEVAVRTYHDIDINWRIKERGQSVFYRNYVPSSELINRLQKMGNERAEFMQTYQTGYRLNGQRHPHSWSIIDAEECVQWILGLWQR